jgi:hypothetical protein
VIFSKDRDEIALMVANADVLAADGFRSRRLGSPRPATGRS